MYFLFISEAIRTRLIATCPETYHARKSRYPSADLLLGTENSPRAVNYNIDYSFFATVFPCFTFFQWNRQYRENRGQ